MIISAGWRVVRDAFPFVRKREQYHWGIYCLQEGAKIVHANGCAHLVQAPGLLLLEPGLAACFELPKETACCREAVVIFDPPDHLLRAMQFPFITEGMMFLSLENTSQCAAIGQAFDDVYRYTHMGCGAEYEALALNALERALCLARLCYRETLPVNMDLRIRGTIEYMRRNLADALDMAILAERVHLSSSRLGHLFRQQTNQTPMQYLEELRLHTARHLLQTTQLSVADIGAKVGYGNQFHFSKRYSKHFGHAPSRDRSCSAS